MNATELTVLSESAPLPFQMDETPGEDVRLRYRYLDLRREGPARAIRLRSDANKIARDVLHDRGLPRDRDADADPVHPRGRPRLPRAGPPAPG